MEKHSKTRSAKSKSPRLREPHAQIADAADDLLKQGLFRVAIRRRNQAPTPSVAFARRWDSQKIRHTGFDEVPRTSRPHRPTDSARSISVRQRHAPSATVLSSNGGPRCFEDEAACTHSIDSIVRRCGADHRVVWAETLGADHVALDGVRRTRDLGLFSRNPRFIIDISARYLRNPGIRTGRRPATH